MSTNTGTPTEVCLDFIFGTSWISPFSPINHVEWFNVVARTFPHLTVLYLQESKKISSRIDILSLHMKRVEWWPNCSVRWTRQRTSRRRKPSCVWLRQKDFLTGSSSLGSHWEDVAFHTALAFLCSVPSYGTAKLKKGKGEGEEEKEEVVGGECWPVPLASELLRVGLSSPICPVWSHLSLVSAQAGRRVSAPLWASMSGYNHPSLCHHRHAWVC